MSFRTDAATYSPTETPAVRGELQLGPKGSLVASPNETMNFIGVGRAKFYELINSGEIESHVEGSARKVLWPSIHAYEAPSCG